MRNFRQHDVRFVQDLSGVWNFNFLGTVDPDAVDVSTLQFGDRMVVPACFDATPRYAGQRGLVAYHTKLRFRDKTPHRLTFGSVHHWCRVFLNGVVLAEHIGGFTPFHMDITTHPQGEADLVVLVDNRFDSERCPLHLEYFDWYHYGGITRPASLARLGPLWIDSVRATTTDYRTRRVALSLDYGAIRAPGPTELVVCCDEREVLRERLELKETSGRLEYTLELFGAPLWSPESPELCPLHIRLGEDDLRDRIGVREVRVAGREILINDQPQELLGYNRHEGHPQFGHALPTALLLEDAQRLKDAGCTFVRGSHYPQDPRFLDLCDELGLLVWSETIGWQHEAEHLCNARFVEAQERHLHEMVAGAVNHPSVILWGVLNESGSDDPACRPAYERLLGQLRLLDGSRPVTYATNRPFKDVCLDLADVVSVNTYPGWYEGEIEAIPEALGRLFAHLAPHEKPLIVSEIGAGALPGWHDPLAGRWSEAYQAALLEAVVRFVRNEPRVCGLAIWQFFDVRTTSAPPRILGRPRSFNNKGVLDEYRRPKEAYKVVKRLFEEPKERRSQAVERETGTK